MNILMLIHTGKERGRPKTQGGSKTKEGGVTKAEGGGVQRRKVRGVLCGGEKREDINRQIDRQIDR